MDVRIGVTHTPKEIEVELAEGTDPIALTTQIEEALASEKGVLWLTDRRGRRVGVPSIRGRLRRAQHRAARTAGSASAPRFVDRLAARHWFRCGRLGRPARPQADLRHRQGRRRQDHHRRRPGLAGRRAGQADAGLRGGRQGQPGRLLRDRRRSASRSARSPRGCGRMSMDTEASLKQYLSLQLKLPLVARIGPLAKMFDFVASAAPGGQGDRHGREAVLGGQGAALRPRRRRRLGQRAHRRPAGRPSGHQPAGAGRAGPPADGLDARHPRRPGHDRAGGGGHPGRDAGQRDARADRPAARARPTSTWPPWSSTGCCPSCSAGARRRSSSGWRHPSAQARLDGGAGRTGGEPLMEAARLTVTHAALAHRAPGDGCGRHRSDGAAAVRARTCSSAATGCAPPTSSPTPSRRSWATDGAGRVRRQAARPTRRDASRPCSRPRRS